MIPKSELGGFLVEESSVLQKNKSKPGKRLKEADKSNVLVVCVFPVASCQSCLLSFKPGKQLAHELLRWL